MDALGETIVKKLQLNFKVRGAWVLIAACAYQRCPSVPSAYQLCAAGPGRR